MTNQQNDRIAFSIYGACAILEAKGLSEEEIIAYINQAVKPAEGYVYVD